MKRLIGLFALLSVMSASLLLATPAAAGNSAREAPVIRAAQSIPNQYIVVLKPGENPRSVAAVAGISPKYVYETALNGFAAELNAGQLTALQHNPAVDYIEQDAPVTAATTQYMDANGDPWGLDRIDQHYLPLSRTYTYNSTGAGVRAYVVDTGIQANHPEFEGRAANMYDALGGSGNDCNGHGTHMAGTIGGRTYGVAKQVYLRGVRVLDCNGSGSWSSVIAGIDWVRVNHIKPAVAHLPFGGGYNASVNTAVSNLIAAGVPTVVTAGVSNANACNYSPASVSTAITVAASDRNDARASFSNYGSCVDIYAPGVGIKSTHLNGTTVTWSGAASASAHVAGVEVLCHSAGIPSCSIARATPNVITGNPAGTPNRLVYMGGL